MYNVELANEDCIFDSADDFETLAEVKEWVEKHSGRFRVMIDDEKGTFMENHDPLANFVHQKNGSYRYYNGWDWVYFRPFDKGPRARKERSIKEIYNTKENNVHYKGKVWVTPYRPKGGRNICLDIGREELMVISFVPEITEERVVNAIKAMGYNPKDWM